MKLLAFSDIHGDKRFVDIIIKKSEKENPEFLICAGDITNFGVDLDKFLARFRKANKKLLIIHGNHESEKEMKKECSKYSFVFFLHKKIYQVGKYMFFGFGGGGFSERDKEFENVIKKFEKRLINKKIIFIVHAPVFNTKLDIISGLGHRGNKSFREFIEKFQPVLVICGHLHETMNKKDKIKKSLLVNPGNFGTIIKI